MQLLSVAGMPDNITAEAGAGFMLGMEFAHKFPEESHLLWNTVDEQATEEERADGRAELVPLWREYLMENPIEASP
jgi:hypothetical protein